MYFFCNFLKNKLFINKVQESPFVFSKGDELAKHRLTKNKPFSKRNYEDHTQSI